MLDGTDERLRRRFCKGTIYKGELKRVCVPGLNCYSCPGALGACPIGSLQAVLGDRNHWFSFYVVGFLLFFGAVLGRCLQLSALRTGTQDLLPEIPFPKKLKRLPGDRVLKYLRYVVLVGFVIVLPLTVLDVVGQGSPWYCKYICPSGTLFAGIPLVASNPALQSALGWIFNWKVAILVVLLLLSVVVYRPFCRYLCPLGAICGLFNPHRVLSLRGGQDKCVDCGLCARACGFGIRTNETPNSPECIRCGECLKTCPHGAICSTLSRRKGKKKAAN